MSTLAQQTEKRAIEILAQCLSYFELLANLKMTAEDDFDARQAENCLRKIIKDTTCDLSDVLIINSVPFITEDLYLVVHWPWVEGLMRHEWFRRDCYVLPLSEGQDFLDSTFFVPITRIIEINQQG
jgi:hypothetical protein